MRRYRTCYADWTTREYVAMARCLLTGRVGQGPDIDRLSRRLHAMYTPSTVFLLNYAHHGIGMALSWFRHRRPDCDEVIVPAYICPSVPQTVRAAGLKVRCVAVGDDLNLTVEGVREALGPTTLAVIAPHMYGCPAPIEALEALCREAGVFLLDDAAQVVGERVAGRLLGTFGDVGVISFAQSKAVVTGIRGSGGVLLVNRPEWHEQAVRDCDQLPASGGRLGPLVDFLWNYVGAGYTGNSGYYFSRLWAALGMSEAPPAGPSRISNLEAAIALVQLDRWPTMRRDRLRLLDGYHESLACIDGLTLPQVRAGRYLARVVVLLPVGVDEAIVRRRLSRLGVEARAPYPPVPEGADLGGGEVFRRLIGLPAGSELHMSDVAAICEALHAGVISSD